MASIYFCWPWLPFTARVSAILFIIVNHTLLMLHVVTIATARNAQSDLLETMLLEKNIRVQLLGVGQNWRGFRHKMELVAEYCKDTAVQDDYVLVIDAYDLLPNVNPFSSEDILSAFLSFNADVVIGAEDRCHANCHGAIRKFTKPISNGSPNLYPNGGFVMGKGYWMLQLYEKMMTAFEHDDQVALGMIMEAMTEDTVPRLRLDYRSRLVYNWYDVNGMTEDTGGFRVKKDQTVPFFIHCPNTHMDGGFRYNFIAKKRIIRGSFPTLVKHWLTHCLNPVYVQWWAPILIFVLMSVVLCVMFKMACRVCAWKKNHGRY